MVDEFMWLGLGGMINQFRRKILKLPAIRIGEHPESLLNHWRVPISHMWSPAFVPPCKDWPPHVDVVGEFRSLIEDTSTSSYIPSPELAAFLTEGDRPVYIGFGSMVIEDPTRLVSIILEAAKETGYRILLQSGWTKYGADYEKLSEEVMVIGAMPHDYLFTQVHFNH
jgi:UDP:flavonoid glycosyltransferase YjiC (YdhE family)